MSYQRVYAIQWREGGRFAERHGGGWGFCNRTEYARAWITTDLSLAKKRACYLWKPRGLGTQEGNRRGVRPLGVVLLHADGETTWVWPTPRDALAALAVVGLRHGQDR